MANSANWHWKTKDVRPWAENWFKTQLIGLSSGDVKITDVTNIKGDCEVGMRKSKVITFYDQRIVTKWSGSKNGTEASGTLTVVEVSHDMDEDDYNFESSLDSGSGSDADAMYKEVRTSLADSMRSIFIKFTDAVISAHGQDLLVNTPASSGVSTPVNTSNATKSASVPVKTASTTTAADIPKMHVNVTKVQASAELTISAPDLFDLVSIKERVSSWTRNNAEIEPKEGADVSLFGGNIVGKIVSVDKPKSLVMTWRAPTWPTGHFGKLKMTFDQGSASTTLKLVLEGVPIGKEDETQQNLEFYYLRSLKQLGSASVSSQTQRRKRQEFFQSNCALVIMLLGALFTMGFAVYLRLRS